MGQYSNRHASEEYRERGATERVKTFFPVQLRYRLREDDSGGYLQLTFDEETVSKLRRVFGTGEERAVYLRFRMLDDGLLHVQNDRTGRAGYKLAGDRTVQVSSLETANIPEPPDDAAHRAGVVAALTMHWTMDASSFNINIPPTLFRAENRGGRGVKLRTRKAALL